MTFDLTQFIVSLLVQGVLPVCMLVVGAWLTKHFKNEQDAVVLNNAVKNSLGAMQQFAEASLANKHFVVTVPAGVAASVSPVLAVGIQYVLDHAGEEAARRGITASAIADKVNAQIGLAKIAKQGVEQLASVTTTNGGRT